MNIENEEYIKYWEYIDRWNKGYDLPYINYPRNKQIKLSDSNLDTEVLYIEGASNGDRNVYIIIKDIEMSSLINWITDFIPIPYYDKLTKNWYHARYLFKVRHIIDPIINQISLVKDISIKDNSSCIKKISKLTILGWSQGAATACILALALKSLNIDIDNIEVFTYGCPKFMLGKNKVNMDNIVINDYLISKDFITKLVPGMHRLGGVDGHGTSTDLLTLIPDNVGVI